ncbi:MAG: SDR family oxidoreductase [Lentisphaeria bacterium]|nr:SDR family oxidoreductase [Lentisphaeria bacterium]
MNSFLYNLTGKIALVTGSSRGIGRAAGLKLAACGAKVIFHGVKDSEKLSSVVAEAGNCAEALTADFGNADEVVALAEIIKQKQIIPDILVLNASVQSYTGIANFDSNEFVRMFRTNVESSCILLNELLPEMQKKKFGRIIFVGSINGIKPASRLAIYGAAKAALMNIAKTTALENAHYGITVNTILPGVIETDRNSEILKDAEFTSALKKDIPMHRFGRTDECADLITFLSSEQAGYITGNEISISGGWQL